jgi:hypothetical protein
MSGWCGSCCATCCTTRSARHPKRGELLACGVDDAELLISDSGPGIAPELRDRLFEPFHTGHPDAGQRARAVDLPRDLQLGGRDDSADEPGSSPAGSPASTRRCGPARQRAAAG